MFPLSFSIVIVGVLKKGTRPINDISITKEIKIKVKDHKSQTQYPKESRVTR